MTFITGQTKSVLVVKASLMNFSESTNKDKMFKNKTMKKFFKTSIEVCRFKFK